MSEGALERLDAYAYLSVPDHASRAAYIAIMRVFTSSLLADLAAPEVAARVAERGVVLDADGAADRLAQLARWGNLAPSGHAVRVTSIAEYHRSRSRYQVTQLGERIQRHADEVMAGADAAREVSRELLGLVARGLAELAGLVAAPGGAEAQEALERISTLFAQFAGFADSVRDFYAYLGQVLFRYDLDGAEYIGFKELLLDYVESLTDDVGHHAPRIAASIEELWPALPALLARVDAADRGLSGLAEAGGTQVLRSRGRALDDWRELRAWFLDDGTEISQVAQLRDATLKALQALLANAKRMIRSSTGELSRRKDLLRLARWFDEADDATAHDLMVAAFGLYGSRHLGVVGDLDAPATASWWHAAPVEVPVSLRERGSRGVRGRTSGVEDHSRQKERLRARAEQEANARQAAAAELRRLHSVRLSPAATGLLLELLAKAMSAAAPGFSEAEAGDLDLDLILRLRRAAHDTTVPGADGDLVLHDLAVEVAALSAAGDTG
ncbi:TIGR02677 family protein [Spongiactinospora sp. TRM90649]|uniref:TIGR02677 family protein n=1 Tax=Spongiactinospora sp. TRM90649 TaxID=3031114 RepID=UPI0023F8C297|nr:TIGR02677 family protein [Spongiactinospora sp. TRM90649]MDF5752430.1 TIGR02677 family protein [Spongiactinospora sp. TRM90649]